jgi:hypothetical protein
MFNQIGIDTAYLIGHYNTTVKALTKDGHKLTNAKRNTPITKTIDTVLKAFEHDNKKRYNKEHFTQMVEVAKIAKGKAISNYVIVIRFIPLLLDIAYHHKKAKGEFCLIVFTGLHQPNSIIQSDAMKLFSQFSKRKTFKLYSYDLAIDHQTDHHAINYGRKEPFNLALMPLSNKGVILKGSSLYINNPNHPSISKILYYDKHHKERYHHKKAINEGLKHWKRLEVTFTFDVTKKENKGFKNYMDGLNFVDDLYEIDEIATKAGIRGYSDDYLNYQINSVLNNRTMNNKASKEQFNSVESLERFKLSDFIKYTPTIQKAS